MELPKLGGGRQGRGGNGLGGGGGGLALIWSGPELCDVGYVARLAREGGRGGGGGGGRNLAGTALGGKSGIRTQTVVLTGAWRERARIKEASV